LIVARRIVRLQALSAGIPDQLRYKVGMKCTVVLHWSLPMPKEM